MTKFGRKILHAYFATLYSPVKSCSSTNAGRREPRDGLEPEPALNPAPRSYYGALKHVYKPLINSKRVTASQDVSRGP